MTPVVLAAEVLQVLLQQSTHADDAVRHSFDFSEPLLVQVGVVQDLGRDPGAVNGRVRVERAHEDLDLRVHALLLLCRIADNRERSDTLPIEPLSAISHVFVISGEEDAVPCSSRNSAQEQKYDPGSGSIEPEMHLCRYRHWRSLGMPCQRTDSASSL